MQVALQTIFAANRKEPLVTTFDRIHQAFLASGLGEPVIRFTFGDRVSPGSVSCVDRVLKRYPIMERFLTSSAVPGLSHVRQLSNALSAESAPHETVQAICAGVPRSYPLQHATLHFHTPEFGELPSGPVPVAAMIAGVMLNDSWSVSGRNRSLIAIALVEADAAAEKVPAVPEAVQAVLARCGKARSSMRVPFGRAAAASVNPESAEALRTIVQGYRTRLVEIVEHAAPPHDLPPGREVLQESLGVRSGPMKPALERVFKPMGYSCRGESGTFTLQRRTAANHTAQLYLDVGTWGHSVTAMFQVLGLGFKASVPIPVARRAMDSMQYPIGDAERWRKIVENLAAIVGELERTLVLEIERVAGPTPEWYQPAS